MNNTHLLLTDVARLLNVKPYRITYALQTGLVPEPSLWIANKRIFQQEDIDRLAAHFGQQGGIAEGRSDDDRQ
jgi:DNA-binding transcriptional MerR regulator